MAGYRKAAAGGMGGGAGGRRGEASRYTSVTDVAESLACVMRKSPCVPGCVSNSRVCVCVTVCVCVRARARACQCACARIMSVCVGGWV